MSKTASNDIFAASRKRPRQKEKDSKEERLISTSLLPSPESSSRLIVCQFSVFLCIFFDHSYIVSHFLSEQPQERTSHSWIATLDVSFSFSTPRLRCNPPLFSIGHSHSLPQIDPFVCPKHQTIRPLASPALQFDFMSIHIQDVVSESGFFYVLCNFSRVISPQ